MTRIDSERALPRSDGVEARRRQRVGAEGLNRRRQSDGDLDPGPIDGLAPSSLTPSPKLLSPLTATL